MSEYIFKTRDEAEDWFEDNFEIYDEEIIEIRILTK